MPTEPKVETLRLRALLGDYEGEAVFCGAVAAVIYETIEEEHWQRCLNDWKSDWPGASGFHEVWIDLPVDLSIFAAPNLKAEVLPDAH